MLNFVMVGNNPGYGKVARPVQLNEYSNLACLAEYNAEMIQYCSSKTKAAKLAAYWNKCFRANGEQSFQSYGLRGDMKDIKRGLAHWQKEWESDLTDDPVYLNKVSDKITEYTEYIKRREQVMAEVAEEKGEQI